jgi:hypothetical protein
VDVVVLLLPKSSAHYLSLHTDLGGVILNWLEMVCIRLLQGAVEKLISIQLMAK